MSASIAGRIPRQRTIGALLALAACCAAPAAIAQATDYPNKPIRFVVAFPAGSATDQSARLIAQQISKVTGHTVVVDNRGGANGFIASEIVAKAPADGYTVLVTTGTTHAANPNLFKKLPYDPVRDFTPISSVVTASFVMVVAPSFPANTVAEFARLAKASPGKYSFASGNAPSRIGGEMFKQMAGVDMLHVPYKGAPQALTDLMGGQVSVMWTDIITGMPLAQGGKLKALAVTGRSRLPAAPAIPTMMEQGFPEYELVNWQGMYLPANAPPAITAKLTSLIHAAIKAEQAALEASGSQVLPLSNSEFAALQARDTATWARVVKAAGMVPE
ncbi:MAG: tripartite tricarboxylate transporter substrate binding protein [Burkholderiales bacterium]|nr:tripartite tricarboxylate transporter substrate binding protein [Burkholderiales bacterium]